MSHVTVERVAAGTYTIKVMHDEAGCVYRKAGIPTHGEALIRARVWVRECGYNLDDRTRDTPTWTMDANWRMEQVESPLKVPDTEIKRMIDEEKQAASDTDFDTATGPVFGGLVAETVALANEAMELAEKEMYLERLRKALQ